MAYRLNPGHRHWRAKRLPGGCFSLVAVLGMVGSMGIAAFAALVVLPPWSGAAILVAGVAGALGALSFLWALDKLEHTLARVTPMSGSLSLEGSMLAVRVPGLRTRELRFDIEREADLRCFSLEDEQGPRTHLRILQGTDVVTLTSSGRIAKRSGALPVADRPFEPIVDQPMLELEHQALEELLQSLADRSSRR